MTDTPSDGSGDSLREHLHEHRHGMVLDLVFAVVWVAGVSALVELLQGPQWALYLLLASGVPAYFLFGISLGMARDGEQKR